MADKIDPSVPSSDYNSNAASLTTLRTVMAGTEAMRAAGETYLPKHPAEESDDYKGRLAQTVLHNRLEGAVRAAIGKPLGEPVELEGDYDPFYDEFVNDVDLLGNSMEVFTRNFFEDAVVAGVAFIMVDMPRADPGMTLAQELAGNIRPYFMHYKAEDVLSCTYSLADGRPSVVDARLRENATIVREFKEYTVERVRHWSIEKWDLWERPINDKGEAGDWTIVASEANALSQVTIVPYFTGRRLTKNGIAVKPPFLDLAWKNIEHWQSSSDQRHILKYARFPILAASGLKMPKKTGKDADADIVIGPHLFLTTEDPQGKFYYVEPSGAGIAAGENDLKRLDAEMDALSMKPHQQGTGGEVTATSIKAAEARENSAVKNMALNLKDALEQAFVFAELYRGKADATKAPNVSVSTEFDDDAGDTTATGEMLTKARQAGELTRRTYWAELKRRGILSANFNADEEEAALDEELTGMGADDPTEDPPVDDPGIASGAVL